MTATTRKKAVGKKRIRPELLPDTARYLTIDDQDYVMIPVADFGEWYEDTVDSAIAEDRRQDDASAIPLEEARKRLVTKYEKVRGRMTLNKGKKKA